MADGVDAVRVGYCAFGRTMKFDKTKFGFQGDAEKPNLLYRLARRNQDVKWVVVGHNTAGEFELPNVENPWLDARARAAATPPRQPGQEGYYQVPFPSSWTSAPAWWCSEVSGFEDDLVELISNLDGIIIHVGQHAPTQLAIPHAHNTWHDVFNDPDVHPNRTYDSVKTYCRYIVRGINALCDRHNGRVPVIWLCPDPRNYLKARDVKWPTGLDDVLAQYQYTRRQKHERYRDVRTPVETGIVDDYAGSIETTRDGELWIAQHNYRYADLELMILPDDWETWGSNDFADRSPAGVATTSTKASVLGNNRRRSQLVRDYLLVAFPDAEVYGKWDKHSLADVPPNTVRETTPTEFPELLNRWRVTVSTPIVESSWTVAKPWQCFAANVVCFYLEQVDDQGWTLPSRRRAPDTIQVGEVDGTPFYSVRDDWTEHDVALASWLRVESPAEFALRAEFVAEQPNLWRWLVDAQRDLLTRRWQQRYLLTTIESRLGLRDNE